MHGVASSEEYNDNWYSNCSQTSTTVNQIANQHRFSINVCAYYYGEILKQSELCVGFFQLSLWRLNLCVA